jgi:hypothetical protein
VGILAYSCGARKPLFNLTVQNDTDLLILYCDSTGNIFYQDNDSIIKQNLRKIKTGRLTDEPNWNLWLVLDHKYDDRFYHMYSRENDMYLGPLMDNLIPGDTFSIQTSNLATLSEISDSLSHIKIPNYKVGLEHSKFSGKVVVSVSSDKHIIDHEIFTVMREICVEKGLGIEFVQYYFYRGFGLGTHLIHCDSDIYSKLDTARLNSIDPSLRVEYNRFNPNIYSVIGIKQQPPTPAIKK